MYINVSFLRRVHRLIHAFCHSFQSYGFIAFLEGIFKIVLVFVSRSDLCDAHANTTRITITF